MGECYSCVYYVYDDDWEEYFCTANLDEDDLSRLLQSRRNTCPYYRLYDEYKTVRKQN